MMTGRMTFEEGRATEIAKKTGGAKKKAEKMEEKVGKMIQDLRSYHEENRIVY